MAFEAKKVALTNLEFMEGIPGNIGGALRMNAGAMGSAMFQVVESVRMMDSEETISERPPPRFHVEYRSCPMLKTHIALRAVLLGVPRRAKIIERKMNECSQNVGNPSRKPPAPAAFQKFLRPFPPANWSRNSDSKEPPRRRGHFRGAWKFYRQRRQRDRSGHHRIDRIRPAKRRAPSAASNCKQKSKSSVND